MFLTGKALIVYNSHGEKGKQTNEEKVALELEKLFAQKGFIIRKILLEPKKKLSIKDQLKNEKKIEPKTPVDYTQLKSFDFIIIGTPVVSTLKAAPLVNNFIRMIPKKEITHAQAKYKPNAQIQARQGPIFVTYSAGIIPGFALNQMHSLLSMAGIKVFDSEAFTSIFDFDQKKMLEVKKFFDKFFERAANEALA